MSYVSIASALETILLTIGDIAVVYDYEPKELLEYPAATIEASSHSDVFQDTRSNERQFTFIIRLYFRNDDAEDAENILRSVADQVIEAIETNVTLGGACEFADPTRGTWGRDEREVPVRFVEIEVTARQVIPR